MRSTTTFVSTALSLLWAARTNAQAAPTPSVVLNAITYKGCFSSSDPLTHQGDWRFQSSGYCQKQCVLLNKAVMGLSAGNECWCGDEVPNSSDKSSDSNCNAPCTGFGQDPCGGTNYWGVFLTGTEKNVDTAKGGSSGHPTSRKGSPTPTTATQPSTITEAGQTIVVTAPGSASSSKKSSSSGPNKAGLAAGVVVGVVALASILGAAWLFLRTRKRRAVEEEYRRNAAVSSMAGGQKPESASSVSDSRLEPSVMMQRRQSDGSIADNQDYSRRILKVTNPDGT